MPFASDEDVIEARKGTLLETKVQLNSNDTEGTPL